MVIVLGYSEITLLSNDYSRGDEVLGVLGYSEITLLSNDSFDKMSQRVGFRLLRNYTTLKPW